MAGLILYSGSLAQVPRQGGLTWLHLQFLLGLRRLGWDVLFLDRLEPEMCVDAAGRPATAEESENLRYFMKVMNEYGLTESRLGTLARPGSDIGDRPAGATGKMAHAATGRSAHPPAFSLNYNRGERVFGLPRERVLERAAEADLLLNVMGYLNDEEILGRVRRRVFIDIDPGFGQMWRDLGLHDAFRGHNEFVTLGQNIGRPDCAIPTCGLKWITMPQPVVLEQWPEAPSPLTLSPKGRGSLDAERPEGGEKGVRYPLPERPKGCFAQKVPDSFFAAAQKVPDPFFADGAFTSIGAWRGPNGPIEYKGRTYGLRVHEFRKFVGLPSLCPGSRFEMALDIHPGDAKDIAMLREQGWSLVDPKVVCGGPAEYRDYIAHSKAEFMIPKQMYVDTNSGLLSDRSVYYLASGRPVLARDTGIRDLYPTGEGLLTFSTLEEAAAGVEAINRDYAQHAKAAREIAVEYFDSDKVLSRLLDDLGVG